MFSSLSKAVLADRVQIVHAAKTTLVANSIVPDGIHV